MNLRKEARAEGLRLLDWWANHLVDPRCGFYGEVDADDWPVPEAPKSVILNTRGAEKRHPQYAAAVVFQCHGGAGR
jgi:hypothetical protein